MNICFFGIYNKNYSRNRVLMRGFRENGHTVFQCNVNPKKYGRLTKFFALFREYKKISKQKFDYVIVAFPGHSVCWFARLLFDCQVIFDMFVSLYNSEVEDRKKSNRFSFRGIYAWLLDWSSMFLSHKILIDTGTHRDFLVKKFFVPKEKFVITYVGSDDSIVFPCQKNTNSKKTIIHFHGTGIPLQGVEFIVTAAKILENSLDVEFRLYGIYGEDTGNLCFLPPFRYSRMSRVLADADIVLGIFGNTEKAKLVIPNKVYEGLAAKRAVITADTPAVREVFGGGNANVVVCSSADGVDLAMKIKQLIQDSSYRDSVARCGYALFQKIGTPRVVVNKLIRDL